jgi:DAACS family dicarboxylate/amino acid:cation (Na+ or H+) symporter
LKTLAYTVVVSSIAVLIGVAMVNTFQPGAACRPSCVRGCSRRPAPRRRRRPLRGATACDFVVGLVPNNIIKAMADGDMLAVMVFALLLGGGIAATRTEYARRLEEMLQGSTRSRCGCWRWSFAWRRSAWPVCTFTLTARLGYDILRQLGAYVLTVILALAIQQFVVYSASVAWLAA